MATALTSRRCSVWTLPPRTSSNASTDLPVNIMVVPVSLLTLCAGLLSIPASLYFQEHPNLTLWHRTQHATPKRSGLEGDIDARTDVPPNLSRISVPSNPASITRIRLVGKELSISLRRSLRSISRRYLSRAPREPNVNTATESILICRRNNDECITIRACSAFAVFLIHSDNRCR